MMILRLNQLLMLQPQARDPGSQVGGIAPQPDKLQNRGYPSGQGSAELGLAAGAGIDFNVTKKIFVGAEGRYNYVDRSNGSFGTYGGRLGLDSNSSLAQKHLRFLSTIFKIGQAVMDILSFLSIAVTCLII